MGWTFTHASHYKANGNIDVKAEIELNIDPRFEVLKSSVIGSAYYAAAKDTETGEVSGHVVLFSCRKDYFNFGVKFISETSGPCYYDCPKSILDLLTETDNENALDWRRKCGFRAEEKARERTKQAELKKLPLNTIIEFYSEFTGCNGSVEKGQIVQLRKILYRGKEIWFDGMYRWKPSLISEHYAIGAC